ncbi:hypothetical protein AB4653_27985, partial [Vibrio sp. 10N.222.48.A3]|uniref:hypothetical protein n=1 Tax=unclassified Vibrio TaxID=2614977 RepID=UPI003553B59C
QLEGAGLSTKNYRFILTTTCLKSFISLYESNYICGRAILADCDKRTDMANYIEYIEFNYNRAIKLNTLGV